MVHYLYMGSYFISGDQSQCPSLVCFLIFSPAMGKMTSEKNDFVIVVKQTLVCMLYYAQLKMRYFGELSNVAFCLTNLITQ